jgi:uncharacterized protein (TIGR03663 family)
MMIFKVAPESKKHSVYRVDEKQLTEPSSSVSDRPSPRYITVEFGLWILVVLVALVARLVNLDAAPLNHLEAREALQAWRAAMGQSMPDVGYSPLLFVGNTLLFALFGASDFAARLWPVLFGTCLVLVPCLFRRRVGRVGALIAGLYLCISPTAVFASRQLGDAMMVAVGGGTLVGAAVRFLETGRRSWLALSAIALALAMTAGPAVWGMVFALGLAAIATVWDGSGVRAAWLWESVRPHLGYAFAVGVVALLVFSTGLGWNVGGVGAVGDLLLDWLSREGTGAGSSIPLVLILYEPLALILGLVGLVWAARRSRRIGLLMGLWAVLGILILSLVPPRSPADAAWLVLPLALLGGALAESVRQTVRQSVVWRRLWPYASLAFGLWVYFYLRMTRYALYGDSNDLILSILALVFPVLLLLIVSLLFVFTAGQDDQEVLQEIVAGSRTVLRGALAGTLVALLAYTVSVGWGVAHVRPADPSEPLVSEPTSPQVHLLVQTLHDISWREARTYAMLSFVYVAPDDSVLTWYLRDFPKARRLETIGGLGQENTDPVLVTLSHVTEGEGTPSSWQDGTLAGQDFVLRTTWDPYNARCYWERDPVTDSVKWPPRCESLALWLFLRQSPKVTEPQEWADLWMRR